MTNGVEADIIGILEQEHGIPRSKLSLSSRLLQDLEIDGDDAIKLFQSIQKKFGTDFRRLDEHWQSYFNMEGSDSKETLFRIFLLLPVSLISTFVAFYFSLSNTVCGFFGVAVFFGLLWLLDKITPRKSFLPITIGKLEETIKQGVWLDDM